MNMYSRRRGRCISYILWFLSKFVILVNTGLPVENDIAYARHSGILNEVGNYGVNGNCGVGSAVPNAHNTPYLAAAG
jgi:phosphoglycerol transferase MdoB-like AlkP superfamily enzyme